MDLISTTNTAIMGSRDAQALKPTSVKKVDEKSTSNGFVKQNSQDSKNLNEKDSFSQEMKKFNNKSSQNKEMSQNSKESSSNSSKTQDSYSKNDPIVYSQNEYNRVAPESYQMTNHNQEELKSSSLSDPVMEGSVESSHFLQSVKDVRGQQNVNNDFFALNKLSQKLDQLGKKSEEVVDPLTRRSAIQSFMKKMKDQFGIEPQDLVVAFSRLETFELGLPPEQTVDKVLNQLDLTPQEKVQAKVYFQKMLKETSANSMADYLKGSERQLSLEVMSQREAQDKLSQKSLDKMNQNFFMGSSQQNLQKPQSSPLKMNQMRDNLVVQETKADVIQQEPNSNEKDSSLGFFALNSGAKGLGSTSTVAQTPASVMSNPALQGLSSEADLSLAQNEAAVVSGFDSMDMGVLGQNGEETTALHTKSLAAASATPKIAAATPASTEALVDAVSGLNFNSQLAAFSQSDDNSTDEGSEESLDPFFTGNSQLAQGTKTSSQEVDFKTLMSPSSGIALETDNDVENVNELVSRAKVLAEKGGGEVKVILKPEGLGEVNVKVALEDGKLNVEMLTESQHAKKLIEKGLVDLKSSLHSQNLDVQNIKVDLSNDLAESFREQQRDAERQFAHQFLQDFRQSNQSFRGDGVSRR